MFLTSSEVDLCQVYCISTCFVLANAFPAIYFKRAELFRVGFVSDKQLAVGRLASELSVAAPALGGGRGPSPGSGVGSV